MAIKSNKEKEKAFSLLKGIACLIVFTGHFYDCFYSYNLAERDFFQWISWGRADVVRIFTYGWYMDYIFCILSGYFSCLKQIGSFRELMFSIMKRYLRLMTFVLIGNLILGALYWGGVTPKDADAIALANEHMPYFRFTWSIFWGSFYFKTINGAMWIVRSLFIGNISIYVFCFLKNRYRRSRNLWSVLFIVGFIYVIYKGYSDVDQEMMAVTLMGVFLRYLITKGDRWLKKIDRAMWIVGSMIIYVSVCYDHTISALISRIIKISFDYRIILICSTLWSCLVFKYFINVGDHKNVIYRFLTENSVSIWVLHIPLIYTIGVRFYITYMEVIRCDIRFIATFLLTLFGLILTAPLYSHTIDRVCTAGIDKMMQMLYTISDRKLT